MPNPWTPERRAAQSARIQASKPWLKSTGPKSRTGKKRSSQNALKDGTDRAILRAARKANRLNREILSLVADVLLEPRENKLYKYQNEIIGLQKNKKFQQNEL